MVWLPAPKHGFQVKSNYRFQRIGVRELPLFLGGAFGKLVLPRVAFFTWTAELGKIYTYIRMCVCVCETIVSTMFISFNKSLITYQNKKVCVCIDK